MGQIMLEQITNNAILSRETEQRKDLSDLRSSEAKKRNLSLCVYG